MWILGRGEFKRAPSQSLVIERVTPRARCSSTNAYEEQLRLETCEVKHEKALTLQARLLRHHGEWLVFLDDPRVPPTNNLAERALRPLVVLRKITFGHRSSAGATRMAKIMTVGETARRHGHRASDIFFKLYTRPPNRVMRQLYAAA